MKKSARGYTLIELLVAISLALIISSFGLAYYSSFNRRQIVEQAAKRIVSDIRLAQNLALSQQKPLVSPGCTCTTFNGYLFDRITGSSYRIVPDCSPVCGVSVKDVELENILLSGIKSIKFAVLTQGVVITPPGLKRLKVKYQGSSYNRDIVVGTSGDLTIE